MNFYESERIIRKNKKYVKSKAYEVINKAQSKGLTYEEIVFANDCALKHSDMLNETQVDILNMVREIAKSKMEQSNENTTSSDTILPDSVSTDPTTPNTKTS